MVKIVTYLLNFRSLPSFYYWIKLYFLKKFLDPCFSALSPYLVAFLRYEDVME